VADPINYTTKGYTIANRSVDALLGINDQVSTNQIRSSFRQPPIVALLNGNYDPKYQYTITATNLDYAVGDAGVWTVPFLHGLGFKPIVDASVAFLLDGTDTVRPLPYTYFSAGSAVTFGDAGLYIGVDSIDNIYINVKFAVLNNDGLTIASANIGNPLTFKFQLQRESTT
jgi:hypothetical protein